MSEPTPSRFSLTRAPVLWGMIGSVVGSALTIAIVRGPSQPANTQPVKRNPEPVVALQEDKPQTPATVKPVMQTAPKPSNTGDAANQPFDPLGGNALLIPKAPPRPEWSIKGAILPHAVDAPAPFRGPVRPATSSTPLPKATDAPTPTPVKRGSAPLLPVGPSGTLDSLKASSDNPAATIADLTAYATSLSGFAQSYSEQLADDQPESQGLLILVPSKSAADFLNHLAKLATVVDQRHWVGLLTERGNLILKGESDRLQGLQAVRDELMKSYKPDDLPVKQIDEEIVLATQSVQQLRVTRPTDGMAIVKVLFVTHV